MNDWDPSVFWPAFDAAGMLLTASTVLHGDTEPTFFKVGYRKPDVNPFTGAQSAEHEIEYQYGDAPTLSEGSEVLITHTATLGGVPRVERVMYRVRQAPTVEVERGADGFFRIALLTRVETDCEP